jgi:hypothetical protein
VVLRARVTQCPPSPRYSDGASTGNPGDPGSPDPGPGISNLTNVDGTTTLVPLNASPAPNATTAVSVTVSFQSTPDGQFLAFMNDTSWEPLNGTTTLLKVQQNPTGYAPAGAGIGAGDQLLVTEDSIQVLDLIIVRVFLSSFVVGSCPSLLHAHARKNNLDDGDHPFHLHGHRPWMYVHNLFFFCNLRLLTFFLPHDDEPEWAAVQGAILDKNSTRRRHCPAIRPLYPRTAGRFCVSSQIIVSIPLSISAYLDITWFTQLLYLSLCSPTNPSGCMGVPLPYCVAYGGRVVDANQ